MNTLRVGESRSDAIFVDTHAGANRDGARMADLAFGHVGVGDSQLADRHLALLSVDTLELDLTDPVQRQFGDYELLELIGEGGMGVVYRAHQISLDREVAVKLLAAGPWASKEFIDRFHREAQNAARMQHPNIVAIYEVGSAEGLHFFSMRLVRGQSLSAVIKRDRVMSPLRAAALLRTVAEAVDYAHRLGVLHLDLKPANVLLEDNGIAHVADFGLARRLEQGLAADNDEVSGTPSYMAPEQAVAGAQKITPATDIWGLGAILYELVSGHPPFLGDSPHSTLKLVLDGTLRSPCRYVPDLPRDLEAIVLKCMMREVANRYSTARALADDLGRFLEGRIVHARPLGNAQRVWRWSKRQPFSAAFALLFTVSMLAGIIGINSQWRRADANAARAKSNATRAEANAAISSERLWTSRREGAIRLQADGKGFEALPALIANIDEQEKAGKSANTNVERHEIGAIMNQGVVLIDRMILPAAHPLAAALSADGSLLALALGDQTVRWFDTRTLAERGRVDLSALPTSTGEEMAPRLLRFIDNDRLLVTLDWMDFVVNPANHDTYLIDLDRARVIKPPAQFADLSDAIYSADGHHALLFDHHGGVQFWQVEPWRPLSARTMESEGDDESWLLGRGARYALSAIGSNRINLALSDPRHLSSPRYIALPGFAQVTAWAENSSGSLVALGDVAGHVFTLDTRTGALRPLPTPLGQEVTWLAFSEDDAWLAVVRKDGAAFAFDVASGNPLNAGQMQQDFDVRQVAISHRERLLVASGSGETAIWRLPEPGPTGLEAERLISRPTRSLHGLDHSLGVSLQTGLLVTAAMDGEVRLWRLPHSPVLPFWHASADISVPGNLYFDGEHLADVSYNEVRVVSTHGAAPTPWITLPQPLAYAQLLDNGSTLLATSGPAMYVFDAATMQQRYPAVPLPANPIRMVAGADGAVAVFAFGSNDQDGFEENLQAYDLKTGQRRPGGAAVKGPLRQFELSPDASRLLATGPAHGATEVFDTMTLDRIGSYPHDPEHPVAWASFTPGSERLWLTARDVDDEAADNADLIAWDPATNAVQERRTIAGAFPVGLSAATGRPVLAIRGRGLLDPTATNPNASTRLTRGETTTVFATSHDGRLIANVIGRDVQLYDATTLAAVGPPLRSNLGADAFPDALAFSADDKYLLGTVSGQLNTVLWTVKEDSRPLADLRRDAELLDPVLGGQPVLQVPSTEQRNRLNALDPGILRDSEARPLPATARVVAEFPVPARDSNISPLLLDLTGAYTAAPQARRNLLGSTVPLVFNFPWGVARLEGIDYDVRGIVELRQHTGAGTTAADLQPRATGIRVPQLPIAAFHVLIIAAEASPEPDERNYASIRVHYVDGSTALLPIRTQRDVPGYTDNDKPVPVAYALGDHLRLFGFLKQTLIGNPRLPNPHPERLIATLDLEAATRKWAEPVFVAITAEPVTAGAISRSNADGGGAK